MLSELQMAIAWIGIVPFRTPGKKDKPLHDAGVGGRQRRKSPVRRCFKSCPPFGGVHRFAPAAGFYGRLTGLLSRSPPTDTRPQARAIWARRKIITFASITSVFFSRSRRAPNICSRVAKKTRHKDVTSCRCCRRAVPADEQTLTRRARSISIASDVEIIILGLRQLPRMRLLSVIKPFNPSASLSLWRSPPLGFPM
jgi:hypothetical protein